MTVGELKAWLAEYADDIDVVVTAPDDDTADLLELIDVGHATWANPPCDIPKPCVLYIEG